MAFLMTSHSSHAGQWVEMPSWSEMAALSAFPEKARTGDLLKTALQALGFFPPLYLQSIFGPVHTWLLPRRKHSEYEIVNLWRALRTMRYLTDLCVASVPREPSDLVRTLLPPLLSSIFYHPTTFFELHDGSTDIRDFPGERWFFVNGVATNRAVAEMNATLLSRIFARPFTVIQNSTNSLAFDLAQCAIGKEYKTRPDLNRKGTMTEPALKATLAVLAAAPRPGVAPQATRCRPLTWGCTPGYPMSPSGLRIAAAPRPGVAPQATRCRPPGFGSRRRRVSRLRPLFHRTILPQLQTVLLQ